MDVRERLRAEADCEDDERETRQRENDVDGRHHDKRLSSMPAIIAARTLLRSALGTDLKTFDDRPQLLVLSVPDLVWVPVVLEAFRLFAKGGRRQERLSTIGVGPVSPQDWLAVVPETRKLTIAEDEVARMIGAGGQAVVITHDLNGLPPALRAAADHVALIPQMSWAVLRHVAEELCGTDQNWPVEPPPLPAEVSAVGPAALRLATRNNISAREYAELVLSIARVERQGSEHVVGPRGLARVPGMNAALEWGRTLAVDLTAYRKGNLPWSAVDRGALLVGPPGTGKTTFGRALAEECGMPLVLGSHSAWQAAGHQGEMLKAMRTTFAEARAAAPCIMFIDEIDSFPDRGKERSGNATYIREIVNGLLAEMDGVLGREGVVVVGACNDAANLDPALKRAGRLDRVIAIDLPDAEGLRDILRVHLGQELQGEPLGDVARLAVGMSGAEIERAVREARRAARNRGGPLLAGDVLVAVADDQGIELTTPGPPAMN